MKLLLPKGKRNDPVFFPEHKPFLRQLVEKGKNSRLFQPGKLGTYLLGGADLVTEEINGTGQAL